jgi:uncharacterized protein YjiS (DUF1127 family)
MADLHATHSAPIGLGDRLAALVAGAREALRRRAVYRSTLRELTALGARDLADLGISPADLERIAHEAAYGA